MGGGHPYNFKLDVGDWEPLPAVEGYNSNKPAAKNHQGTTRISASAEQLLVGEETTRQQLQQLFYMSSYKDGSRPLSFGSGCRKELQHRPDGPSLMMRAIWRYKECRC
jgi:hypothetical protein